MSENATEVMCSNDNTVWYLKWYIDDDDDDRYSTHHWPTCSSAAAWPSGRKHNVKGLRTGSRKGIVFCAEVLEFSGW